MKKLSILLLTALILFAGCGGNPGGESGDAAATDGAVTKAAFVTPQSLGDNGPIDDMNAYLKQAGDDFGIEVTTYEALRAEQYEEAVRNFAQNGYDVIVVAFQGMTDAVMKTAPDFPNTRFIHIFSDYEYGYDNVASIDFACWEANYVCGVAAAMVSKSGQIGHIVGDEENTIRANGNAIRAGARTVNPDATVDRVNAGTFDDPAKGKEIALSLYGKGCDIIITDCAKTALGIIEAAQETDNLLIGDSTDHSAMAPAQILMDTGLGFGATLYGQVKNCVEDTFTSGVVASNYQNGGIYTTRNTALAENVHDPETAAKLDAVWAKVDEIEAQLRDGTLVVEKDVTP